MSQQEGTETVIELLIHRLRICTNYRGADKYLARPTSPCILFEVGNISFDASLVSYI
jgi:hypothetical protein